MNERFAKSLLFFKTPRGQQVVQKMDTLLVWTLWLHVPALLTVTVWFGKESVVEMIAGAAIATLVPMAIYWSWPGSFASRMAIATGAMLFSDLLIHASGGLIEYHFHIFVFLAVLGCYRDFRVLLWVTTIVATHHILLNFVKPDSVFEGGANFKMVLLHALFVVLQVAYQIYDIFTRSEESDFVVSTHHVLSDISGVSTQVSRVTDALSQSASHQASALQQVSASMTEIEA